MTKCKWLFCIVGILLFLAACGRETAERQAEAIEMEVEGQSAVVRFDQGTLSSGPLRQERMNMPLHTICQAL